MSESVDVNVMPELNKCEECGANAEFRVEGSTQGVFCTKCDWAVVTTHIPKIAQDITKYRMYLLSMKGKSKEKLKALANVANINLIQANKMAAEKRPLIAEAEAIEINEAKQLLDNLSISYEIEPNFPY